MSRLKQEGGESWERQGAIEMEVDDWWGRFIEEGSKRTFLERFGFFGFEMRSRRVYCAFFVFGHLGWTR